MNGTTLGMSRGNPPPPTAPLYLPSRRAIQRLRHAQTESETSQSRGPTLLLSALAQLQPQQQFDPSMISGFLQGLVRPLRTYYATATCAALSVNGA